MNRSINTPQAGFSIIEIMVGMAVGLITLLVILGLYAGYESQKRTTTSGNDAHTTGMMGIYAISRDVRQAGYGFASLDALNCKVQAYDERRSPSTFALPALAPVIINPADIPAGQGDVVQVTYGNSDGLASGVSFEQPSAASANYKVSNRSGFTVGSMMLAVEPGKDCSITQITELPASGSCGSGGGGSTDVIVHNNGKFSDPHTSCTMVESYRNKPGGLGITYTSGKLYDLGALPTTVVYAVRNNRLTRCDFMASDCTSAALVDDTSVWVPIADNIMSLQAQYGRDTTAPMDQTVDLYDKTTPTGATAACGWSRIPVIHLALVARSSNYEKTEVTSGAAGTAPAPAWLGGTSGSFATGTWGADWKHYRYKVFETTMPLRNVIWMGVQASC